MIEIEKIIRGKMMNIFEDTIKFSKMEKYYTAKLLKNLMVIERDKLYSDLKFSSLHKFIVKKLNYSDAEATIRVNAVRLMLMSPKAEMKIAKGELTLTNASEANKALKSNSVKDRELIEQLVDSASDNSTRGFKKIISEEFEKPRFETVTFDERIIKQFDRMRKEYGDLSTKMPK